MRILQELSLGNDGRTLHRVGGADLCDLLDISPAMLTELKKRGIARHLKHDAYDLEATVRAYVQHLRETASGRGGEEHVAALSEQRARLARAQADERELRNAKIRGDLVDAAEVTRVWQETLRGIRARILSIPGRLRGPMDLDAGQVDQIDRELRDALAELSHVAD
jgi:phage terminase Nu1 subunit (DNA packaging protein)